MTMRIAARMGAGIVIFMVAAAVAILLSAKALLNGVVKEHLLRVANGRPGTSLSLGTIRYDFLSDRISCDRLSCTLTDIGSEGDTISLAANALSCSDINWLRVLLGRGFTCGDLVVKGMHGRVASLDEKRLSPVRRRRKDQQPRGSSALFMPIFVGRLSASGDELSYTTRSASEIEHDSVTRFAVTIENLHLELGSEEQLESALARARIECETERVGFRIPGSAYRIGFASGRVSESKSMVEFDSLRVTPTLSDTEFFASNRFGSTRYRLAIGRIAAHGLDLAGLLKEEKYTARSISITQPVVDIAVNKRRVSDTGKDGGQHGGPAADSTKMPNEILAGIKARLDIDSVSVNRGTIEYAELYPNSSTPAALRWSGVRLAAAGISNRKTTADSSSRIEASGMFLDTARMVVSMELPLGSRKFSLSCQGTVDALPRSSLNRFLEVAERIRVTSGRADSIKFALAARDGRSSGTVRPFYHDLEIEMLARQSGHSNGLPQKVGTMLADIKIKDDNMPDGSGGIRQGPIEYVRNPEDPFFRFLWFSLRDGLGKVVGF